MVLRKPALPGCGAAVRKQLSAGCPPSTSGCHTPLKTVKSSRCSLRISRYGDNAYPRPLPFGKKCSGNRPRLLQTPRNRRGLPPGVAPAPTRFATAPNAGLMASNNGRKRRMPAPRRNLLRDKAGRVQANGAFIKGLLRGLFIEGFTPPHIQQHL